MRDIYGRLEPTFWNDDLGMLKLRWIFLSVVGGIAILVAVLMAGAYMLSRAECNINGEEMGVETHYRFWGSGCYVALDDGTSMPLDRYLAFEEVQR